MGADCDLQRLNVNALWKVNRYVLIPSAILFELDGTRTLKRGDHRKAKDLLQRLLEEGHGVDLAMASTLLRFRNPAVFQIIDRHAYRALYGTSLRLTTNTEQKVNVYLGYVDDLIRLCQDMGLDFETIDRVLYLFDKEKNGKL